MLGKILDPDTRKRLARFRQIRRANISFWLLIAVFAVSLFSNFIANDKPILVKHDGHLYWPIFKYYPSDTFTGSGILTRTDYKALAKSETFTENKDNWMLWPPIRFGPAESLGSGDIEVEERVQVVFSPTPRVATINLLPDLTIQRALQAASFFGKESDRELGGVDITETLNFSDKLKDAIGKRFKNEAAPAFSQIDEEHGVEISMTEYQPRGRPSPSVRITLRDGGNAAREEQAFWFTTAEGPDSPNEFWKNLSESTQTTISSKVGAALEASVANMNLTLDGKAFVVRFVKETVQFPFRPVKEHPFGLDNSGRDVLVLILYATRTALIFGAELVIASLFIGMIIGGLQGYYGGWLDIIGQRLIEIWESLPFLYIMILLGSIYGRSFTLLLVVYALFNWISISYYNRGEFLKQRKMPYVESARVMGIHPWKVMAKHIQLNALVPVITLFPFLLVSAIFSLAALDYLGFGLPAGTPSWGDLLSQGQEFPYAWWLVFFPSLALFVVILLAVFIGEGIRSAFDPKHESRLE